MSNNVFKSHKFLWLAFTLLAIIVIFIIKLYSLDQKFCNWLTTLMVYPQGTISPMFQISISLLNLIISSLVAIATCLYLIVTWKLLINARKEHKDNQTLTKNMHSDSLTPYIYLEEIEYDLHISSISNSDLRIYSAEIVEENKTIKINSLKKTYNIEDIIVSGTIRMNLNNASNNIADCTINVHGIWQVFNKNVFLHPRIIEAFIFNVNSQVKSTSNLLSLLSNKESIRIFVSAKGPGFSAQDQFSAICTIVNNGNKIADLMKEGWMYIERSRIYI